MSGGPSFQILLTRLAANDEDEDRAELTLYFLRLAPWIVRPASPSARAGTMMAAIRTKFEVALERQLADMPAPPPPNKAGGCWKELPKTLAKKKAIWNPRNEDHRCFMWCVLAHCLGVEGLDKRQRSKTVSCSGSFLYPELAGRRGSRPPGWQPALADAGVDFSGLPTDRPAPQRRAGGGLRLRVAADPVDGRAGVLPRPPAARPERHWRWHSVLLLLHSGHYSLIHNFQALAGRQGLTLGATPTNTGGCMEYKCPRCMARFTAKALCHRAAQCYREIAERTWKAPLPRPEKSVRGKASAELAPLTCYAGQRRVPRRPRHAEQPSQAGRPLPHLKAQN